ncbi:hypothetical protein IWX50DRAFT_250101 [Phyllosticta citricarpa]
MPLRFLSHRVLTTRTVWRERERERERERGVRWSTNQNTQKVLQARGQFDMKYRLHARGSKSRRQRHILSPPLSLSLSLSPPSLHPLTIPHPSHPIPSYDRHSSAELLAYPLTHSLAFSDPSVRCGGVRAMSHLPVPVSHRRLSWRAFVLLWRWSGGWN